MSETALQMRQLVNKYETNQAMRALDTWIVLKHLSSPSLIQNWNKQKVELLAWCKCSETILRHRLKLLQQMELIQYDRNNITVCSWKTLSRQLAINIEKKLVIQYKKDDTQKIYQWLIAAEIQSNKDRQDKAITRKLSANPEIKINLDATLLQAGADRKKLTDPQYYLRWMRIIYKSDFIRASMAHEELIAVRPDNNRSVNGIANAWHAKAAQTACYWKKVLQREKIIDVSKVQIISQERVRNKECKVVWLRSKSQTMLCLCDQIELLFPWLIDHRFKLAA
jgi:hypothetical protein